MKSADNEKLAHLQEELKVYEMSNNLTDKEKNELYEWVAAGNSVHSNPSMACYEGGKPCDFIDVYRDEEEIHLTLEKLSPRERDNYIARLNGEDILDNLREDLETLTLQANAYYEVLAIHGLVKEAEKSILKYQEKQEEYRIRHEEWINSLDFDETDMPFNSGGV